MSEAAKKTKTPLKGKNENSSSTVTPDFDPFGALADGLAKLMNGTLFDGPKQTDDTTEVVKESLNNGNGNNAATPGTAPGTINIHFSELFNRPRVAKTKPKPKPNNAGAPPTEEEGAPAEE